MTSGAPLTNSTSLPSARRVKRRHELVLDSNGMASMRGYACCSTCAPCRACLPTGTAPFGRGTLNLPYAFGLEQLRVVAEHRHAAHQSMTGSLPAGWPPFFTSPSARSRCR